MASKIEYLDYLKQVPLFSALGVKELKKVASLTFDSKAEPGEVIVREGKPGEEFYVISDGTVKVTLRDEELAKLGPGDFFGEMALVDQGPRAATVTAETPVTLLVLGSREFSELMDGVPAVGKKVLRGVASRLRAYQDSPTA
ncbi:MAG: cyclic nucleotide-binding domain-containing protein [Actinomycetota bacterium]